MGISKNKEKKHGKKGVIALIIILVLALAAAAIYFFFIKNKGLTTEEAGNEPTANTTTTINAVSAYGIINIGTTEETLDISKMTGSLKIEKILFSTGDTVEEGTPLLQFTEESVKEVEAELKKNLREAELSYRSGKIEYEKSLITAKYDYEAAILKGEQADAVYKESVASLKSSLNSATESYNNSKDQLAEYKDAQANDTYYEEYKVGYYLSEYENMCDLLVYKIDEWNLSWPDVTSNMQSTRDTVSQQKYICHMLYEIATNLLRSYESALEKYETATGDLSYNLLSLQLDMSTLEENYLNSKKSYETGLLTAEKTKQTSKTQAELALSEYEATIEKAKTDYDTLLSAYEEALEDYETFTACVVDNRYIATTGGTVTRTNVRSNGSLSAGGRILTYSDLSDATVSVSVDQSDIAKLQVGDAAICYASSTGVLNGTIISISPVTQSSSISSVSYSVTVRLDNSNNNLSSNTTVTVLFGSEAAEAAGALSESENGGADGMPDMGNFDFGNMPDMDGSSFGGFGS